MAKDQDRKAKRKEEAKKRDAAQKASGGARAQGKDAEAEEEYQLPVPDFDEKSFMQREIEGGRTAFATLLIGLLTGGLAYAADRLGSYMAGWLVIILAFAALGPILRLMGFSEESTKPKQLAGNWFLLFFTAFALWIILWNV